MIYDLGMFEKETVNLGIIVACFHVLVYFAAACPQPPGMGYDHCLIWSMSKGLK